MNTIAHPVQPTAVTHPRFAASIKQRALPQGGKVELYNDVVILGGARTPFSKSGKQLANVSPFDLLRIAMKGALEKSGVAPEKVNQLIMGNIVVNDEQNSFLPRHVALSLGMPKGSIASVANRVCGTGFELARLAAHELVNGGDSVVITGGVENMTKAPAMEPNWKAPRPEPVKYNPLIKGLTDPQIGMVMFQTADELASRLKVTRDEVDAFSAQSHTRALAAQQAGKFKDELVPVKKGDLQNGVLPEGVDEVSQDDTPRGDTSKEKLGTLKIMDQKRPDAIHTPGSSSAVVDGAAALVMSTGKHARQNKLNVLANLKGVAVTGCDPKIMGFGPARAINELLKAASLTLEQVDIVEVNEAFGGQTLAVAKAVAKDNNVPLENLLKKLNPDGGAIAMGHPLAASGSRIMLHSALQLKAQNKRYAVVSACIGGGQGIAALIENPAKAKPGSWLKNLIRGMGLN